MSYRYLLRCLPRKEDTVAKMVDQDIDSLAVVTLLREDDIAAISLATVAGAVAFMEEAGTMGLQEETVSKMVDQDIDSLSVVGLLREADISALSLSIGQRLLLTRWVSVLREISIPSERCVSDSRGMNSRHSPTYSFPAEPASNKSTS